MFAEHAAAEWNSAFKGDAALNKQFVAMDSHKHCLLQWVWSRRWALSIVLCRCFNILVYVYKGLKAILNSDTMVLTYGGAQFERSGREIVFFERKCKAFSGEKWLKLLALNSPVWTATNWTRFHRLLKRWPDMRITLTFLWFTFSGAWTIPRQVVRINPKIEQSVFRIKKFVEMRFDSYSPMNTRLKETLLQMLGRNSNECCHLCSLFQPQLDLAIHRGIAYLLWVRQG